MWRLSTLLLAVTAGCAAGREGLSEAEILTQAPVIREAPAVEGLAGMDEADANAKLAAAREALLREDYETCLAVIRETLEKLPPMSVATELRAMRYEARKLLFARQILEGRVLAARDVYGLGEEMVLRLTLRNVSPNPVRVPREGGGGSPAVIVVDDMREDWDIYGNVRAERSRRIVPLEEELTVPVGGKACIELRLPTGEADGRHRGFSVHRFRGTLRPSVILAGKERYYSSVELEEAVVRVLPPGYEPIAADPLGTLDKAYRLGAPEHLLLAAELAPPERRRTVVSRLVSCLEGSESPIWTTVMVALRRLTGRSFANRPEAWVAWWKESGIRGEDGT